MDITTSLKENNSRLQTVIVIGGVCFFVGRAGFTEGLEPVGAALILTLAMYSIERFTVWHKLAMAAALAVILQSILVLAGAVDFTIEEILSNCILTAAFTGIFETLSCLLTKDRSGASDELALLSVSAVIMLMIIGAGMPWLVFPAGLVMSVFAGYTGGIAEGLVSGFAAGTILYISAEDPEQMIWMITFGAVSGLFKEHSRAAGGITVCMAAAVIQCYEAIPAGLILTVMPEIIMVKIETALREIRMQYTDDSGKNLKDLSLLFSSLDNPRSRLAYEFKAMSQLHQQRVNPPRARGRTQQAASAGYSGSEERSGDSCAWEMLPDGRFAIALSDGMGKGERAAQESHLAVTSVMKMLKAGLDTELVLKLLNAVLMIDTGQETFATMDLGILEPESGEMHFYKIGASPTIIKRGDKVEVLAAPTMPMGVTDQWTVRAVSTIVRPGDHVIMMSDGIMDSVRGDMEMLWLVKVLSRIKSRDPQTICDLIIREAAVNYEDREKDDMTAVCFRVKR